MTDTIRFLLSLAGFPVELFAAAVLFGFPLEKRDHSAFRLLTGFAALLFLYPGAFYLLSTIFPPIRSNFLLTSLLYSFLGYLSLLWFVMFWRNISFPEGVQLATNAYLMQHLAYCLYTAIRIDSVLRRGSFEDPLYPAVWTFVYAALFFSIGKRLPEQGHYDSKAGAVAASSFFALAYSLVLSAVSQKASAESPVLTRVCLLYGAGVCFNLLWSQWEEKRRLTVSQELDLQQELFRKYKEQYEMSAENVELINRKCHDLKHQIAALRHISDEEKRTAQIRELERSVMIYDSVVKTGNEVLDTILTEKSLICEDKQIQLSCVADGAALSFLDAVDVYTIFGNALDNAIESVSLLADPDMRSISVLVTKKGGMVMIQTENYFREDTAQLESPISDNSPHSNKTSPEVTFPSKRQSVNDLPRTTKTAEPGYHGFGLKSIRYTAEKYGGFLNVEAENGIFLLRVVIPEESAKS